jgi:tetratricopeptide (TPR) repeat protein
MDEQRLLNAARLQEEGKLREAAEEFLKLAQDTDDPIDRAGILVNAATTFRALGEYDRARHHLAVARRFAASAEVFNSNLVKDDRSVQLQICLDLEEADICRSEGKDEEALTKFKAVLTKYRQRLGEPDFRDSYEMIETRHAFLLADAGRWKEALPILEEGERFREHREGIAFYLGHCYLAAHDYIRAEQKLTEALRLGGLPNSLEFRAHCELGMTYYNLRDYKKAKKELEKGADMADPSYLKESQIWRWLEMTCRALGLKPEAENYSRFARPS